MRKVFLLPLCILGLLQFFLFGARQSLLGEKKSEAFLSFQKLLFEPSLGEEEACQALSRLEQETLRRPNEFRVYLRYARGLVLTQNYKCFPSKEHVTKAKSALERAALLAPKSGERMTEQADLLLRIGERGEAFKILQTAQEEDELFSPRVEARLFALPQSEAELGALLPKRFPQMFHWISAFRESRPADYAIWSPTFATALTPAIENALALGKQGKPQRRAVEKYLRDVFVSDLLALNDGARKQLDALFVESYPEPEIRDFLKQRADLQRAHVLYGEIGADFRPESNSILFSLPGLSGKELRLDRVGQSLGVRNLSNLPVQMLVLQSQNSVPELTVDSLQILASRDNQAYEVLRPRLLLSALLHDRQFIAFAFDEPVEQEYFKVHYLAYGENSNFSHSARTLIQLYSRDLSQK